MKDRYLFLLAIIFAALILAFINFEKPTVKVYDCSMAEWHPDIPKEVKEECRRLKIQYDNQIERYRT